jgi:hypothetical protein
VRKLGIFVDDDDNDTFLFHRLEENALASPNPERKGCPAYATLKAFVAKPSEVKLSDLNDLHIFECAECTRELIELRRLREETLRQAGSASALPKRRGIGFVTIAASLCGLVLIVAMIWRAHDGKYFQRISDDAAVWLTLDLNGEGLSCKPASRATKRIITFPRKLVNLHLILPYHSPAGDYRIAAAKETSLTPLREERAHATAQGARTELRVNLDLRRLSPGPYDLRTAWDGGSATYSYPFSLD